MASCQQQSIERAQPSVQMSLSPQLLDKTMPSTSSLTQEIRIGLLLPLSGAQAELGQTLENAITLGFLESAQSNTKLLPFDTCSAPDGAQQAMQKALSAGVHAIVGPLTATETAAIQGLSSLPILTLSNDRSVANEHVFMFGIMPDDQVRALTDHLQSKAIRKIAVLAPATPYGNHVAQLFQTAADQKGIQVQLTSYSQQNLQNPEFLAPLVGQNIGGFVILESGQAATALASLLAYHNLISPEITCYGLDNWRTSQELATNPLFAGATFAALDATSFAKFESHYMQAYGQQPQIIAGIGYDAIRVALFALSTGKMNKALITPDGFRGVYGVLRLLPSGTNQRTVQLYTFTQGQTLPTQAPIKK